VRKRRGSNLFIDSAAKPPIFGKMARFAKENLNDFNNNFLQESGELGFCSRIFIDNRMGNCYSFGTA